MNIWLCTGCNNEVLSKEDPLYCEYCGNQNLKDLGPDEAYQNWKKRKSHDRTGNAH